MSPGRSVLTASQKQEIIARAAKKELAKDIAARLSLSYQLVRGFLTREREAGRIPRAPKFYTAAEKASAVAQYKAGVKIEHIARNMGRSNTGIGSVIKSALEEEMNNTPTPTIGLTPTNAAISTPIISFEPSPVVIAPPLQKPPQDEVPRDAAISFMDKMNAVFDKAERTVFLEKYTKELEVELQKKDAELSQMKSLVEEWKGIAGNVNGRLEQLARSD